MERAQFDFEGPELRPCPFCGGAACYHPPKAQKKSISDVFMVVECTKCGAIPYAVLVSVGKGIFEKKQAIANEWNRRV